jgi:membrane protease YdiL (CAAX protease family)
MDGTLVETHGASGRCPGAHAFALVLAFVFGCLYALMYTRTGSLLGPSLAHGFSNTIFVVMLMLEHLD